ncbi:MAG: histidinol dehydrogenase [Gemmatimonadetes bacterium]|nr:histidinol dehydrogenase [Gemmatimonadota bacterium]
MIRTLHVQPPFDELRDLAAAASTDEPALREAVAAIVHDVATRGDDALLEYTRRFDRLDVADAAALRVGPDELAAAAGAIDPGLLHSLRRAADNVRSFHEKQGEHGFLDLHPDGTVLGQRVAPLRRVGIYVPGGRAAYPSSVLMNAIPAKVAGVDEIAMVSPAPGGEMLPVVLAAAHVAGVTEVLRIGGAQAVAALAYGTQTIGRVDKIVGPGNKWQAEAKRQVFGRVDIDMIAGPSEIMVIADEWADPVHVAADLIGQAEHDPDAIAWLVTTSAALAERVPAELERLLERNPRRAVAREALETNGAIIIVPDIAAAAAVADLRAPEHLELLVAEPLALAGRIRNAGAIFLGAYSPEPMGDYFAGPNHVLPTGGTARFASPLGVYDFVKRTSLIGYSRERLLSHANDVIRLAEAEGLFGHAEAVRVRLDGSA